jgi:UDP-N-acetylmuramyl pentapeptide synthase
MVSIDHYKQELHAQMERSAAHGMPDILVNAGELCRTLHGRIGPTDACCKAMREELKPGDVVLIEASAGVGMTVRYKLPRIDR